MTCELSNQIGLKIYNSLLAITRANWVHGRGKGCCYETHVCEYWVTPLFFFGGGGGWLGYIKDTPLLRPPKQILRSADCLLSCDKNMSFLKFLSTILQRKSKNSPVGRFWEDKGFLMLFDLKITIFFKFLFSVEFRC